MPNIYQAVKGRQLRIPIIDSSDTTGLVIGDFTISAAVAGALSSDPETDLSLTLAEVDDSDLPGYYELVVTPSEVGLTYLRLVDNDTHEIHLQVAHESQDLIGQTLYGAEGTLEITVEDASENPIEGVLVRLLTSTGSGLVGKALTDSSGEVSFDLPTGSYYARFSKSGYDFSEENPTSVVVLAWENVTPVISELLPSTASEGDSVAIKGSYFNGDNPIVTIGGEEVTPEAVSDDGTVLIFVVPEELDSPATVRVKKDDPDNEGEYLTSSSLSLTIS